jgi:hypothetical protein
MEQNPYKSPLQPGREPATETNQPVDTSWVAHLLLLLIVLATLAALLMPTGSSR